MLVRIKSKYYWWLFELATAGDAELNASDECKFDDSNSFIWNTIIIGVLINLNSSHNGWFDQTYCEFKFDNMIKVIFSSRQIVAVDSDSDSILLIDLNSILIASCFKRDTLYDCYRRLDATGDSILKLLHNGGRYKLDIRSCFELGAYSIGLL